MTILFANHFGGGTGVLMLRVGASLRGWFNEFVKEKKLAPGVRVYEELYLWIRACELAGCCDQLNLGGNASLEHDARSSRASLTL